MRDDDHRRPPAPASSYPARVARDIDSAGVYFLSVEDFEWRPERPAPDEPAEEKKEDAETCSTAHED